MSYNHSRRATYRSLSVLTALLLALGMTAGFAPAPRFAAAAEPTADELAAADDTTTGGPVVDRALRTGKSVPLREIASGIEAPTTTGKSREINRHEPRQLPRDFQPAQPPTKDPLRQEAQGNAPMPAPIINVEGQSDAENEATVGFRVVPPDTNGDVGPNHYVQWINLILSVYDKTDGSRVLGPIPGNAIFAGFGGACETTNNGDPTVLYDQFANRWVLSQFANPAGTGASQCVAVSQTDDPTGSYFLYEFPTPGNDYPKMGVWGDAYYMTYRNFASGDFIQAVALERDKMLVGDPTATSVRIGIPDMPPDFFEGVLPPHIEGVIPSPADAPAPYAMAYDDEFFSTSSDPTQDFYKIWHFSVDFANPGNSEISGPLDVSTEEFDASVCGFFVRNCIDQPSPGEGLDPLNAFTMWRAVYHGGTDSLWVNHTVDADGNDTAGIRWAQINDPTGTPTLNQAGTYAPADGESRWTGSLAVDAAGNMALGYSLSGTETFPSIRYAGRLASDPPGVLGQGETELWAGTGAQTGSANRWGDYSSMSIDESDGCTFWYTNEYYETTGSFDFHTRIGSFQFPTCVAEEIGTLEGTVTDASSGDPIAGATVEAVGTNTFSTTTDANGDYSMTVVADTYDVTGSAFGFLSETVPDVVVSDGGVTTQDFALDPAPTSTVSGTVTDGSGHGWPLYARIEVSGAPISDLFTDPVSGEYSFDVPEGTTVTLTVNAISDGYNAESREITAQPGSQVEDFALTITPSCTAPGYEFVDTSGASEDDSESRSGDRTLQAASRSELGPSPAVLGEGSLTTTFASNNGFAGNTFDLNPIVPLFVTGFDVNITAPGTEHTVTIYWKEGTAQGFESNPEPWNVLGSDVVVSAGRDQPTHVDVGGLQIAPGQTYGIYVDLESYPSGQLRYTNGGPTTFSNDDLALTTYVGKANPAFLGTTFSFRQWNGTVHYNFGDFECLPVPGGLLVGNVRDANSGEGLNDASVTSDNEPADTTATFGTPDDPNLDEGFYILFSSLTGQQPFTATKELYSPDTQTPDVVADDVVAQDFNLGTGLIEADPTSIEAEVLLGAAGNATLTLNNVGTGDANFEISDVETTGASPVSLPPSRRFPRGEAEASAGAAPTDGVPAPGAVPEEPIELNPGSPAYAQNAAFGYYTVFDVDVPEVLPSVAPFDTGSFIGAGEFVGGSVFMIDGTHTMYEVDAATGELLDTIPVTPPGGAHSYTGMALDPTSGTVYAASCDISTSRLFELDVASGEASLIGTITNSPCAIGIAVDGSGQMYAHDIVNDALISIDKATAAGTIIGSLGFDANFGQGLAWDPATDNLLLAAFNNSAFRAELRVADRETGNTALIGALGEQDPGGLSQLGYMGIELARDAPWLSVNPTTGTVPAGGSVEIDVNFEALPEHGITHPGDYTADLLVSTDTPTEVAPIPVTMTVPVDGFGAFKGTVLDEAGGVPDATVEAIQGGEVIESTITDALGQYTFHVPPGTWELHAFKGDREATITSVTVRPDRTVTVNFKISEGAGTFTGRVTGGPGGPVPDATVEALQDGVVIATTTTDAKGMYTLEVAPGTYDLHAFKGDREAITTTVTVGPDRTVTVNFKIS